MLEPAAPLINISAGLEEGTAAHLDAMDPEGQDHDLARGPSVSVTAAEHDGSGDEVEKPRTLPPDLPTSLDDRRSFPSYNSETEIYDGWQGELLYYSLLYSCSLRCRDELTDLDSSLNRPVAISHHSYAYKTLII